MLENIKCEDDGGYCNDDYAKFGTTMTWEMCEHSLTAHYEENVHSILSEFDRHFS